MNDESTINSDINRLHATLERNRSTEKLNQELQRKISLLEEQYSNLDQETSELRLESNNLLSELKTLSAENSSLRNAKEKSTFQINELFIQIQDWKTKYEDELKKRKALETELSDRVDREDSITKPSERVRHSYIFEKLQYNRTNPNIDFKVDGIQGNRVLSKSTLEEYYDAVTELISEARYDVSLIH